METTYGFAPNVLNEIITAAQKHGVRKLVLFGSRAKGNYTRASDIDLAVYGGDAAGFAEEAEETVQTLLRFDVTDMRLPLSPDFRKQIEGGIVLYEEV